MGTEVHYRSSFPGHDKMRDLNADTGNNWPPFYINKTLNEHFYNGCFPSSLNGYPEYDKEMLKRTMLEHEAIFRKQVNELHRLYSIQKELMEEFQKNGSSRFSKHEVPSKRISYSNKVQSEYATRMLPMSYLCTMNNSQKRVKARYNDEIISPVNFLENNLQSSSSFLEIEALQRVAGPYATFRKCPKIDLRLPPGAYIDGTERSEEEIDGSSSLNTITCSRICNGDSEIELKLKLANVSGSSRQDVCKLNYHHNKSLFTDLADLNEPNRQTSVEGASDSGPVQVCGPRTRTEENHRLKFPLSLTTSSVQIAFPKDEDYCERDLSNVFQGIKEKIGRGGAVCYNDTGKVCPISFKSSISHKQKKDPMFCEPIKLNVNKVSDIISTNHNEASTQFGHEQRNHFQISEKCPGHSGFCNLGKLTSLFPDSFSSSLKLESNITPLPLVPTWTKLSGEENHASSPFSAISSFDGSGKVEMICSSDTATKYPNDASGSWQVGSDLKSPRRIEEKSSPHLINLNDGFQLQSHSTSQLNFPLININLNVEAVSSFSGTQDGLTAQQNKSERDIDRNCEDFLPGQSWLKRTACESLEPSRLPTQVDLGFNKMVQVYERKSEDVTSLPSRSLDVFSSLHERENEIQNNHLSDSLSSTKIIAPIFDKFQQNLVSSSNEEKLVIHELKHVSMSNDDMFSSEKSISVENNRSYSRNNIDLNSVFPFVDDPDSFYSSENVQADVPSIHLDPISVSGAVPLIYLGTPVITLQEDNITSDVPSTPFSSRDGLQEEFCYHEMLIKEAAENIVKLSLDGFKHKDDIQSSRSATPPGNALYLLAEMILSNNNSIELNAVIDCCSQSRDDGLDLFELKTLQLEEIKPEKLWCRPHEVENTGVYEKSKASLLLAKPRKAQGRKRRQRKDFQKDILPALATLSRQEGKKDLQAIGELMKASGTPWQAGIRRRNMRGNAAQAKASQKRRHRNASVSITVAQINPPTALFMADGNKYNPEFDVDRQHMIGWGRTTRRCRRQRCPPISISTTLM